MAKLDFEAIDDLAMDMASDNVSHSNGELEELGVDRAVVASTMATLAALWSSLKVGVLGLFGVSAAKYVSTGGLLAATMAAGKVLVKRAVMTKFAAASGVAGLVYAGYKVYRYVHIRRRRKAFEGRVLHLLNPNDDATSAAKVFIINFHRSEDAEGRPLLDVYNLDTELYESYRLDNDEVNQLGEAKPQLRVADEEIECERVDHDAEWIKEKAKEGLLDSEESKLNKHRERHRKKMSGKIVFLDLTEEHVTYRRAKRKLEDAEERLEGIAEEEIALQESRERLEKERAKLEESDDAEDAEEAAEAEEPDDAEEAEESDDAEDAEEAEEAEEPDDAEESVEELREKLKKERELLEEAKDKVSEEWAKANEAMAELRTFAKSPPLCQAIIRLLPPEERTAESLRRVRALYQELQKELPEGEREDALESFKEFQRTVRGILGQDLSESGWKDVYRLARQDESINTSFTSSDPADSSADSSKEADKAS